MTFEELKIIPPILRALADEGYTTPTDIQVQAIPPALEGRDILGSAQTGTGKTAAFAVPILQLLSARGQADRSRERRIRSLILTPTRELAVQVSDSFTAYGKYTGLRTCVVYGGVSQKSQEDALRRGADILVATPGRLYDLMGQRLISLADIEILVLDEADRMLDMGFIHDVKRIISKTPTDRQTLFFSATLPSSILAVADMVLRDPVAVAVTPEFTTVEAIEQKVYLVDKINKRRLLVHLLNDPGIESALVFARTRHGAERVVKELCRSGINAQAIHGDKSQSARQAALGNFKNRRTRVLVATDIAARGLDINELSHVINFDLPEDAESYIHRIGRTGRAGRGGIAISFCDFDEKLLLTAIERKCGQRIPVAADNPFPSTMLSPEPPPAPVKSRIMHFGAGRRRR